MDKRDNIDLHPGRKLTIFSWAKYKQRKSCPNTEKQEKVHEPPLQKPEKTWEAEKHSLNMGSEA